MQTSFFMSERIIRYTQISAVFVNVVFSIRDSHLFCLTGRYLMRLENCGITVHKIASDFYSKMQHLIFLMLDHSFHFFHAYFFFITQQEGQEAMATMSAALGETTISKLLMATSISSLAFASIILLLTAERLTRSSLSTFSVL